MQKYSAMLLQRGNFAPKIRTMDTPYLAREA